MNVIKWRSQEQEHLPTAILIRGPISQYSKPPIFCGDNAPPNYMYMYAYMPRQVPKRLGYASSKTYQREVHLLHLRVSGTLASSTDC